METYYQLVDRDTSTITVWWKVIHIFCFVVVILSGFITAHVFGRSIDLFGGNCVLFANIAFSNANNTTRRFGLREIPVHLTPINLVNTDWGDMHICYFCQFTPLMCMITAVIWGTFFIMSAKGGAGYISDMVYGSWRIVYPALGLTIVATVSMLFSTWQLHKGIDVFCANFEEMFQTKRCTPAIDEYTLSFFDRPKSFMILLKIALICSYICFSAWVIQLGTLILRIVSIVDFELIKITVIPVVEEVQQNNIDLDESEDTLVSFVDTEIYDSKKRRGILRFARKNKGLSSQKSTPGTSRILGMITPRHSSQTLKAHANQNVKFIDESPTNENTRIGGSPVDEVVTTSFSSERDRKKSGSPAQQKKNNDGSFK